MVSINTQRAKYVFSDWLTTSIAFLLFNVYRFFHFSVGDYEAHTYTLWMYLADNKMLVEEILFPLVMLFVYWLSGYYNNPFQRSRLQELYTTAYTAIINTLLIYLVLLTNDQIAVSSSNYAMLATIFGLLFGMTYLGRVILTGARFRKIRQNRWAFRTIIIGTRDKAREETRRLESSLANLGYVAEGYVLIDSDAVGREFLGKPVYSLEDLKDVCQRDKISQILITLPSTSDSGLLKLLGRLFALDIPVKIAPDLQSYLTSGIRLQDIYGEPFVDLTTPHLREASQNIKRTLDVLISAIALILLAAPFLILAFLIKSDSKGPVFYRQQRIGRHRSPFFIYKFRTMYVDAEAAGPQLSSDNDPRVTRIGRIMRKYRIDELPQFWNVLTGDMSLVGPRPEREFYIRQILEKAPYYTLLHQVRPGITSWGMVKYGYASDVDQMIERVPYDLLYLSNMSISVDFKILIYTVRTVLLGKGK